MTRYQLVRKWRRSVAIAVFALAYAMAVGGIFLATWYLWGWFIRLQVGTC